MANVLVLGAAGPAGYNLCLSLRLGGHAVTAHDDNPWNLELLDSKHATLHSWLGRGNLMRQAREGVYDLVMAQPDSLVMELAHQPQVPKYLPPVETLEICADKHLTWLALPPHLKPRSYKQCDETEPVWCRLKHGAGSRGAFLALSRRSLARWLQAHDMTHKLEDWIVQEYLPGPEYAWQAVYHEGRLVACQGRERLEYLGPNPLTHQSSSPSVAMIPEPDVCQEITDAGADAVASVGHGPHGVFGVDMRRDKRGQLRVTEINAGRFYTTSLFFTTAGLNLPDIAVRTALGERVDDACDTLGGYAWVRQTDMGYTLIEPDEAASIRQQWKHSRTSALTHVEHGSSERGLVTS